jgi:hypothetical protein
MKNIFKLSLIILLVSISPESFSQTFGIKAGVNFSNMLIKESELFIPYNTNVADPKVKTGFHIGGVIEYPVLDLFSLESGLFLTSLGTRLTTEEPFGATTLITEVKHDLYYLSIPLAVKVPFSIKGFNFYGSVGGYAGMGLIGNAVTIATFGDLKETTKGKIAWGSEQGVDYLKRLDYGLTFGVGIKYSVLEAGLFYNLGLANISSDSEIGSIAKNRVFGISVGYSFGESGKSESSKLTTVKSKKETVVEPKAKSEKPPKVRIGGKKGAAAESERLRVEKIRTDSIAAAKVQQETIRLEKARTDSIEAARVLAAKLETEKARMAKVKADSIEAAKNSVVYRVQFASNATKKGNYKITFSGRNYTTWEYSYSGAYRSTVGEFKTFAGAMQFQKTVRASGYPQAFVVAFKNNVRTTDPALFK